jgi:hypothetical protein
MKRHGSLIYHESSLPLSNSSTAALRSDDCCASTSQAPYQCYARMCPLSVPMWGIVDSRMSPGGNFACCSAAWGSTASLIRSRLGLRQLLDHDTHVGSALGLIKMQLKFHAVLRTRRSQCTCRVTQGRPYCATASSLSPEMAWHTESS